MRALALACLAAWMPLAGCSLISRSEGTTIAPHLVFLAPTGCEVALAKIHRGGYALITSLDDSYALRQGDVLEGPARVGESIFRRFPPEARNSEWSQGIDVAIDVRATDLELSIARRQLDGICLVEGEELPRLPGAEDGL
ncbi:MAG: hypothetical protein AAFQ43_13685 [Bacteroidota bacterium]